jgi:hypothetical protein
MLKGLPAYRKAQENVPSRTDRPDDAVIKMAGQQLNEEELEVPTFMRKKIGK